jgi:hypothetical protein
MILPGHITNLRQRSNTLTLCSILAIMVFSTRNQVPTTVLAICHRLKIKGKETMMRIYCTHQAMPTTLITQGRMRFLRHKVIARHRLALNVERPVSRAALRGACQKTNYVFIIPNFVQLEQRCKVENTLPCTRCKAMGKQCAFIEGVGRGRGSRNR